MQYCVDAILADGDGRVRDMPMQRTGGDVDARLAAADPTRRNGFDLSTGHDARPLFAMIGVPQTGGYVADEDLRKIARRLCDEIGSEKDYTSASGALTHQRDIDRVTAKLLQIWNARGAADAQAVDDRVKRARCGPRDLRDAIKALDR